MIVGTIMSILTIIAYWKVFTKANEAGWKSLIPIYNVYITFKIAKNDGFLKYLGSFIMAFVLMMIASASTNIPDVIIVIFCTVAFVLYIFAFIQLYKMYADLAECFGKERVFALGLLFLSPIFMMILGFGSETYCEVATKPVNEPSHPCEMNIEENTEEPQMDAEEPQMSVEEPQMSVKDSYENQTESEEDPEV